MEAKKAYPVTVMLVVVNDLTNQQLIRLFGKAPSEC